MLSEGAIVAMLRAAFPLPDGIGDDAAILPLGNGENLVISKDLLVEDIHFRLRYFSPADLAHKALEVNLSDIAAMGAKPDSVLLGLSIPPALGQDWITDFIGAFTAACRARHVALIGGDTTASPDKFFLSVTALGRASDAQLKRRNGAKDGDVVFVAGDLGFAHLGLTALETARDVPAMFTDALRHPTARLAEGLWLGRQRAVTAMMDLSDGLFIDLGRLCHASGAGAAIACDALPVPPAFAAACSLLALDPVHTQLAGGEDYGLLFTVAAEQARSLADGFRARFGYPLQKLGAVTAAAAGAVTLMQEGKKIVQPISSFSHFGELSVPPESAKISDK